jgi:hypothetical protein
VIDTIYVASVYDGVYIEHMEATPMTVNAIDIAVHIEDGRAQLLKDCRLIGISAHKIKDINVLAAEYVKKINFIRGAV